MNYLKEIIAFGNYLMYNHAATGEIALWYALMAINNQSGWREVFTAETFLLTRMTGLSKSGLADARNGLKQKGLIDYIPGRGRRPGEYRIIPFVGNISDTTPDTMPYNLRIQSSPNTGHNGGRIYNKVLYKQKLKQKEKEGPPAPQQKNAQKNLRKYGEYQNVLLSDEELDKLKSEFPSDWAARIERLSEYIASSGKKYKSHLATIRSWAKKDASAQKGAAQGYPPSYDLAELEAQGLVVPDFDGKEGQG